MPVPAPRAHIAGVRTGKVIENVVPWWRSKLKVASSCSRQALHELEAEAAAVDLLVEAEAVVVDAQPRRALGLGERDLDRAAALLEGVADGVRHHLGQDQREGHRPVERDRDRLDVEVEGDAVGGPVPQRLDEPSRIGSEVDRRELALRCR